MLRFVLWLPLCAALCLVAPGCRTSTRSSGLPGHIRTVEVEMFSNKTMYKDLEGRLTRQIIDRLNADANIKVVSRGGDAVITGEITRVSRRTLRETTTDEPATVQLIIHATYSFYDEHERRYIKDEVAVVSNRSSSTAGLYEAVRGESVAAAEEGAMRALAQEIVWGTVAAW